MIDFPQITNCTVFPLPEGTNLEFKASFLSCTNEKMLATLCGLLNSGGGHLVIGVADDTREIVGVKTDKTLDKFLLMIDNIYHLRHLKKVDGAPVPVGTIKTQTIVAANNKTLLVVSASAEPGEKYTVKDGTIWYRLAASNYKQTTLPTVYSEEEINAIVDEKLAAQKLLLEKQFQADTAHLSRLAHKYQSDHDLIKNRFKALEGDLQQIVQATLKTESDHYKTVLAAKQTESELQKVVEVATKTESDLQKTMEVATKTETMLQEFRDMLYKDIQLKKAEAEQRLAAEKASSSWFSSIVCCFYAQNITM
jgi:predicted HTH transcriptional regulator